jgi:hypothetical protein
VANVWEEETLVDGDVCGVLVRGGVGGAPICRRFEPGGSLDRRVNCRRVPQPSRGLQASTREGARGLRERRPVLPRVANPL